MMHSIETLLVFYVKNKGCVSCEPDWLELSVLFNMQYPNNWKMK